MRIHRTSSWDGLSRQAGVFRGVPDSEQALQHVGVRLADHIGLRLRSVMSHRHVSMPAA